LSSGLRFHITSLPIGTNGSGSLQILAPRAIGFTVALGGIRSLAFQERVSERPHDRLGMTPGDCLEGPPGRGREDRLAAYVAKVPSAIPPEQLDDLPCPSMPDQGGDRDIGGFLIPTVHRLRKALFGLVACRDLPLYNWPHAPVPLLLVAGL